eukprot:13622758-Alexandrium_andersonii.AAC.1
MPPPAGAAGVAESVELANRYLRCRRSERARPSGLSMAPAGAAVAASFAWLASRRGHPWDGVARARSRGLSWNCLLYTSPSPRD